MMIPILEWILPKKPLDIDDREYFLNSIQVMKVEKRWVRPCFTLKDKLSLFLCMTICYEQILR